MLEWSLAHASVAQKAAYLAERRVVLWVSQWAAGMGFAKVGRRAEYWARVKAVKKAVEMVECSAEN